MKTDQNQQIRQVELTENEIASLMASRFAIDSAHGKADRAVHEANQFIGRHRAKMEAVEKKIRDRLVDCPNAPVSEWEFGEVDPISFKGTVGVPEDDVKPEDDTDFGDKDIEPEDKE